MHRSGKISNFIVVNIYFFLKKKSKEKKIHHRMFITELSTNIYRNTMLTPNQN
jgi:hypothetical protein